MSVEPSMEDILSSIKRIIAEEGDSTAVARGRRAPRVPSAAVSAPSVPLRRAAPDPRDVLELSNPVFDVEILLQRKLDDRGELRIVEVRPPLHAIGDRAGWARHSPMISQRSASRDEAMPGATPASGTRALDQSVRGQRQHPIGNRGGSG